MSYLRLLDSDFSSSEIKEKDTLIVVDTNYLLNIFRSYYHGEEYLKALKQNQEKIYIPFMCFIEFFSNLENVINHTQEDLDLLSKYLNRLNQNPQFIEMDKGSLKGSIQNKTFKVDIKNISGILKEEISSLTGDYIERTAEDLIESINTINEIFERNIEKFSKRVKEEISINKYNTQVKYLKEELDQLLDEVLGEEYTQEKINNFVKDMDSRYEKNIPPGFCDENKDNYPDRIFGTITFPKKAGDLILWRDVINYVKEKEFITKIFIVTDDGTSNKKSDWRYKLGNERVTNKNLRIEFYKETGKHFELLTSKEFIKMYSNASITEKQKMYAELDQLSSWGNNSISFTFLGESYSVKTQSDMMYIIFDNIVRTCSVDIDKILEFRCIETKDSIINSHSFIFKKTYDLNSEDSLILGTTMNINDKFKYIKRLLELVNISSEELVFLDSDLETTWKRKSLKSINADELVVEIIYHESVPNIDDYTFYKDGIEVNLNEINLSSLSLSIIEDLETLYGYDADYSDEIADYLEKQGYYSEELAISVY
ncbi:hypothetical protein HP924_000113 [Enterococcus faecium]|nr:hypothetical protein [Enterococcus faecium]